MLLVSSIVGEKFEQRHFLLPVNLLALLVINFANKERLLHK